MRRRTVLKSGGLALVGLGLGCSSRRAADMGPRRPPIQLQPPNVSWDRVIRTTVGLRPHRASGFVLKAEKLGDKTLIHNYGHGGAGMSLSWGTAHAAADIALDHLDRRAAVLGCGVVGLTSARELQRRGFDVTIYAASVPPDTTSNMSLAGFTPTSGLVELRSRTPEWEEQFRRAVTIAYRRLQLLVGPKYGITWIQNYTPTDDARLASGSNVLLPAEVEVGQDLLRPGEHPFPTQYAVIRPMMRIEPSIYLDALVHDFVSLGGKIVIRRFESLRDIAWLAETLVVNCTGLGAKELFEDEELVPLKGQLTVVIPQPEVSYGTNGGIHSPSARPGIGIHMMPRTDGIILGGTSERDNWSLEVNEEERKRIVEGHIELYRAMRSPRKLSAT
ncbi:MAG TPA: FAD-dependent oxidoreductase [Vicinamibacteria bacterium]|nr:FAD-dependent oxidoreductase [Vicinamibacteria bacterium]